MEEWLKAIGARCGCRKYRRRSFLFGWLFLEEYSQWKIWAKGGSLWQRGAQCAIEILKTLIISSSPVSMLAGFGVTFYRLQMPGTYLWAGGESYLNWKQTRVMSSRGTVLCKGTPRAIIWSLWNERNARLFEGLEVPVEKLIHTIKEFVWALNLEEPCIANTRLE